MTDLHPLRILAVIFVQCFFIFGTEIMIPSSLITNIYIGVAIIGFISGILAPLKKSHLLRLIFMWSSLTAFLFFLSMRAWMILFDNSLLVAFLLVAVLAVIGALPYLNKKLSEFLYWEQLSPRTAGGKLFQRFAVLAIVIWTFIARSGYVNHHHGDVELLPRLLWYLALVMYTASTVTTFYAVYQCMFFELKHPAWKKWSWRGNKKKRNKNESSEQS